MDSAPPDRSRQHLLAGVTIACVSISSIIVCARVLIRHFIVRSLGMDDWAMVVGWICTVAYMIEVLLGCRWGFGLPTSQTTPVIDLMKIVLSVEVTYYFAVASIKISILFFYLRLVSSEKTLKLLCTGTIGLLVVFLIVCEVTTLAQCVPIQKQWDFVGAVEGHCINTTAFFYSTSAFNIITDIWIIVLPIRMLSKIHRPKREVVVLFIVFGMGVLSCVASMVRLYSIRIFTLSKDPFHDVGPVNIWSIVEISVAIVCASIPALKPLFSKKRAGTSQYTGKISNRSASVTYGVGPLSPNEGNDPKIDTNVSSAGNNGFPMAADSPESNAGRFGSREAINKGEEYGGIEMDRDFTFYEERVERR